MFGLGRGTYDRAARKCITSNYDSLQQVFRRLLIDIVNVSSDQDSARASDEPSMRASTFPAYL